MRRTRFAAIKDLTAGRKAEIGPTLEQLGELLRSSKLKGVLLLRILRDPVAKQFEIFKLAFATTGAKVSGETVKKPNVELITTPETWMEIASGKLSPIDAYLQGRMRVRGDAKLAQRLMKHVAKSPGRTHLCLGEE